MNEYTLKLHNNVRQWMSWGATIDKIYSELESIR